MGGGVSLSSSQFGGPLLNQKSQRALLVPSFLLIGSFLVPAVAALQTYTEFFDDDVAPNAPTAPWYTFTASGTGDQRVSTAQFESSPNALLRTDGGAPITTFDLDPLGIDGCSVSPGPTLAFSFRFAGALPGGVETLNVMNFFTDAAGSSDQSGIQVVGTGAVKLTAGNVGASNVPTITGVTIVANTWYKVRVSTNCQETVATAYFVNEDVGTTADAAGSQGELTAIRTQEGVAGAWPALYIDNVTLSDANDPPPNAVGAAATVSDWAANSLVGFDVDAGGSTVIVRAGTPGCGGCTIGGHDVQTYDGFTLTDSGANSPFDTDCDRPDGVMSIGTHVLYVECGSAGGCADQDPCEFDIRSPTLGAPQFGDCADECPSDLDMSLIGNSVSDAGGDLVAELGEVRGFPIDFSSRTTAGLDRAWAAMAYTGTNGIVGVQVYSGFNNAPDVWEFDETQFSTTTPDQLCTGADTSGQYYLGAADAGRAPAIYNVALVEDGSSGVVTPTMTLRQSGSSALSGGKGISCAGDEYITVVERGAGVADTVWVIDLTTGQGTLLDTVDGADRGVAMSQSNTNRYYAYVDGSFIYVSQGIAGNTTCALAMPTGAFHSMKFSFSAQSLWVATDDVVARFAVQEAGCTTDQPESDVGGSGGAEPPAPPATGQGPFAGQGAVVGGILGVGAFGGQLFLGVVVMGMMAYGFWEQGEKQKWFAILGAIAGFLIAWAFGFFTTPVVFAMVVLCGILWFVMNKVRSGA